MSNPSILKKLTNTEDKKRLLSNFLSLSGLQVFTYILPLITLPYLVRVLGVEKYGLVMFAQSFIMFFNILVDYGFNLSATREIAVNRDNKTKVTEIYSSVMTIKVLLLGVSFVVLSGIVFSVEKFTPDATLYLLTFLMVVGQALFPIWYFQGMERMKYITIINILSRVIFTAAIFVFIHNESDYMLVPVLNGLGACVGSLYALWLIRTSFQQKFEFQNLRNIALHFKDSTQFFFSRLSSVGYSNINIFLSGILLTPTFVTYYSLADKAISILLYLFDPLVQAIYPYFSKSFSFKLFKKIFISVILISFFQIALCYLLSDVISFVLLGMESKEFIQIFKVLLLVVPVSVMYVMLGAPLLLARGYIAEFNKSIVYGFIAHLIILVLIYAYTYYQPQEGSEMLLLFASSLVLSKILVLIIRLNYVIKYKLFFNENYNE